MMNDSTRRLEAIAHADGFPDSEYRGISPEQKAALPAELPRVCYDDTAAPGGHRCPQCRQRNARCTACSSITPLGFTSHCARPSCLIAWQNRTAAEPRNACAHCGGIVTRDLYGIEPDPDEEDSYPREFIDNDA